MLAHIVQVTRSRKWWYSALALGAFGMQSMQSPTGPNVLKHYSRRMPWLGRASRCPSLSIQQDSILSSDLHPHHLYAQPSSHPHGFHRLTSTAPCFFSAAIYYILGEMITQYGRRYSLISARMYLAIFVSFDIISIVIQAVGGASASKAGSQDPPGNTKPGTDIMMAGIIIQLISMTVFGLLWLIFIWRARAVPISRILLVVTTFSAFCIIVRNFYRAVELSQGWKGYLITHEVYFAVLDGALMAMSVGVFNIFYPAKYLTGVPKMENDGHEMLTTKGV